MNALHFGLIIFAIFPTQVTLAVCMVLFLVSMIMFVLAGRDIDRLGGFDGAAGDFIVTVLGLIVVLSVIFAMSWYPPQPTSDVGTMTEVSGIMRFVEVRRGDDSWTEYRIYDGEDYQKFSFMLFPNFDFRLSSLKNRYITLRHDQYIIYQVEADGKILLPAKAAIEGAIKINRFIMSFYVIGTILALDLSLLLYYCYLRNYEEAARQSRRLHGQRGSTKNSR